VFCLNAACFSGLSIMHLVSILPVSLVCPFSVFSQCCLCLWFVHSVSRLNAACVSGLFIVSFLNTPCVSGLSILCPVQIMPVSMVCPFRVLSQ
jgi:hypothetical protein